MATAPSMENLHASRLESALQSTLDPFEVMCYNCLGQQLSEENFTRLDLRSPEMKLVLT